MTRQCIRITLEGQRCEQRTSNSNRDCGRHGAHGTGKLSAVPVLGLDDECVTRSQRNTAMDALAQSETKRDLRGERFYPYYAQTRNMPTVSELTDAQELDSIPARVRYYTPTGSFYVQALDDDGYAVGFIADSRGFHAAQTFWLPELESLNANPHRMLNFGMVVRMDESFTEALPDKVRKMHG